MKLERRQRQGGGALAPFGGGQQTPFNELDRIRNQINRIFEDPFGFMARPSTFLEGWGPPVDVYEDHDKLTIKAELPGMKKEEIEVSVVGNALTIAGERKEEEEKRERENYRAERFVGRFQRTIPLPNPTDASKVQASYKDGVLTVVLPKSEEAKRKQIQVKTT